MATRVKKQNTLLKTTGLARFTTYLSPELIKKLKIISATSDIPVFKIVGNGVIAQLKKMGGEQ